MGLGSVGSEENRTRRDTALVEEAAPRRNLPHHLPRKGERSMEQPSHSLRGVLTLSELRSQLELRRVASHDVATVNRGT